MFEGIETQLADLKAKTEKAAASQAAAAAAKQTEEQDSAAVQQAAASLRATLTERFGLS